MYDLLSCITAWKHARRYIRRHLRASACEKASTSQLSNVDCKFFFIPGGDSKVALRLSCRAGVKIWE
jgi:hypothetical protein